MTSLIIHSVVASVWAVILENTMAVMLLGSIGGSHPVVTTYWMLWGWYFDERREVIDVWNLPVDGQALPRCFVCMVVDRGIEVQGATNHGRSTQEQGGTV